MELSQRAQVLQPSPIRSWTQRFSQIEGMVSLTIGEPWPMTPMTICRSATEAMCQGITHYPPTQGNAELLEKLAVIKGKKWGYNLKKEQFLITSGAQEAISVSLLALLNKGDEVLVQDPYYVGYQSAIDLALGKLVPVKSDANFQIDCQAMSQAITSKTKAVLLSSPANPTGRIINPEVMNQLADLVRQHDLFLILDLVYEDLAYTPMDYCALKTIQDRLILIGSFSKPYAMTGWRLGYLAAPQRIIDKLVLIHQAIMSGVSSFSQVAAITALDSDISLFSATLERCGKKMWEMLQQMGLECPYPQGGFYLFPSIRKTGLSSEDFAIALARQEKVAVLPGTIFGQGGTGRIRISYGGQVEQQQQALSRMQHFLSTLR